MQEVTVIACGAEYIVAHGASRSSLASKHHETQRTRADVLRRVRQLDAKATFEDEKLDYFQLAVRLYNAERVRIKKWAEIK